MKITQLVEMAAPKKICPDCGKSMAGNHYWYKGGWKCKKATQPVQDQTTPATATQNSNQPNQPAQQDNAQQVDQQPQQHQQAQSSENATAAVSTQPLEMVLDVIADAKPLLDKEIEKINKVAKKIGAPPIQVEVVGSKFDTMAVGMRDAEGNQETVKYKVLTIKLTGSTPRVTAEDGSTWDFIGVITPSASHKAILKLTPGAEEGSVKHLYHTSPYYCDHCKKIRNRSETFIVRNGNNVRQVGRSCLKDFVGGANPQSVLTFFAWFQDPKHLEEFLKGSVSGGGDDVEGGMSFRGTSYYGVEKVIAFTVAAVKARGSYVSSMSANERGGVSTSTDVRDVLFGRLSPYASAEEKEFFRKVRVDAESTPVQQKAKAILDWFSSLPKETIESNNFFKNISIMIDDGEVASKNIGYIVGLYAAYQKSEEKNATTNTKAIIEWPQEWGNDPRPVDNKRAVVKFVKSFTGVYGTSYIYILQMDDGVSCSWKYSGKYTLEKDDEITIAGHLEPETYYNPARIKFVPNRSWLRSDLPKQIPDDE